MPRLLNDTEFERFVSVADTERWRTVIDAWLTVSSPYGEFGWDGIPVTYSSRTFSPYWDEEFEQMSPMDREWYSCPIQCLHVSPLHLEILKESLPGYDWCLHQKWGPDPRSDADSNDKVGHVEVVGRDPDTGDVVVAGFNVEDPERSLDACGFPNADPETQSVEVLHLLSIVDKSGDWDLLPVRTSSSSFVPVASTP